MIGRLLSRGGRTPVESRLDALEAAMDVKLQALLATAVQAITEAVRAELARERQRAGAASIATSRDRPSPRSLLDLEAGEQRRPELRRFCGTLTRPPGDRKTETGR